MGQMVAIRGLTARRDLNGCLGSIRSWDPTTGRAGVQVLIARKPKSLSIKLANLYHHPPSEFYEPTPAALAQGDRYNLERGLFRWRWRSYELAVGLYEGALLCVAFKGWLMAVERIRVAEERAVHLRTATAGVAESPSTAPGWEAPNFSFGGPVPFKALTETSHPPRRRSRRRHHRMAAPSLPSAATEPLPATPPPQGSRRLHVPPSPLTDDSKQPRRGAAADASPSPPPQPQFEESPQPIPRRQLHFDELHQSTTDPTPPHYSLLIPVGTGVLLFAAMALGLLLLLIILHLLHAVIHQVTYLMTLPLMSLSLLGLLVMAAAAGASALTQAAGALVTTLTSGLWSRVAAAQRRAESDAQLREAARASARNAIREGRRRAEAQRSRRLGHDPTFEASPPQERPHDAIEQARGSFGQGIFRHFGVAFASDRSRSEGAR